MAKRKSGMGSLPAGLIRLTMRPDLSRASRLNRMSSTTAEESKTQGRGEAAAEIRQPKRRTRRKPPEEESKGRKIGVPDDVHDRLWQIARQRRITVSALATDILDKNLPRFRIEREG